MPISRLFGPIVSGLLFLVVACDGDDPASDGESGSGGTAGSGTTGGSAGNGGKGGTGGKGGSGGSSGTGIGESGTSGASSSGTGGGGGAPDEPGGQGGETSGTGGRAGTAGAAGDPGAAGSASGAVCAGKTLTGSCTWTNASECADFYGEDATVVMAKCPSSIGTFSEEPCETANNVGSCEKQLPQILGSGCEVFWYFAPTYETQEISDGCPPPDTFHAP
jgi:hypothetical protein